MARNNDVFQVLVTKGNQAVLAKEKKVTDLLPGQIGVFSWDTNISIDATTPVRNFYLAVGLDVDGTGATTDVMKSSGSHVQGKNIVFYSFRPHTPGRPMKVLLKNYTANCETEYGIKLELRNQEIYRTQGYNQFTKTYSMKTSCCDGCEPTCPSGDANEITKQLYINIMNDASGLIRANIKPRPGVALPEEVVADSNGNLTLEQVDAIMEHNATLTDPTQFVYTDLEVETVTQGINRFNSVNTSYFYPREAVVNMTKVEGFKCTGEIEVTQQAAFEEGSGYDLSQKEYVAAGWKLGPYRVSTLNGLADPRVFNADPAGKYDQIHLTYDQFSIGAWLEYYNNLATTIAIPATDTVTRNGLVTILDALLNKFSFEPLADDAAGANVDPTVVERTTDETAATDGLSS